jgi:hypothetical protein
VEPYLIATSLADKGTYADAFGSGTGPSAHTAPLLPMILLLIIRVVGVGLPAISRDLFWRPSCRLPRMRCCRHWRFDADWGSRLG